MMGVAAQASVGLHAHDPLQRRYRAWVRRQAAQFQQRLQPLALMGVGERCAHIDANRITLIRSVLGKQRLICGYLQLWITVVKDALATPDEESTSGLGA